MVPLRASAQATLLTGYGGTANYGADCLGMNDDGSSNRIDLTPFFPAGLHFFSMTHTAAFVNTNGNITFSGALPTFTPNPFPVANQPMIAPFWADVDTRTRRANGSCNGPGDGVAVMGPACMNPMADGIWWHLEAGLMVVTWDRVARFRCELVDTKRDTFQLIIRAVPPMGCTGGAAGTDFDVEFRFHQCDWEVGDASGDANMDGICQPGEMTPGLPPLIPPQPCVPGQSGFDEGIGASGHYTAIPGSLMPGIAAHLCTGSNTMPAQPGIWQFQVRNGVVMTCPGAGMACTVPSTMGVCAQGRTSCAAGSSTPTCQQQVQPTPEICNNLDDDCDGMVDETSGGNLCGSFQICSTSTHTCVDGCGTEFGCPTGYMCVTPPGATDTQCIANDCVGVTCSAGERCVASAGGHMCVMPCQGVVCPHGQTCDTGRCIDPCANVGCDACTACVGGSCATRCTATSCPAGQSCDTGSGLCVDTGCVGMTCPAGQYCAGGTCMDACGGVTCPFGQMCMTGQCVPATSMPDAGSTMNGDANIMANDANFHDAGPTTMHMDAGPAIDGGSPSGLHRTGGGCACRAGASHGSSGLVAFGALAMLLVSRRKR
jgi:MYXO-CTERM domain-containing protein